jgi:2-hydroxy-3-keto-5-methylthiopentenyl-1-phosphate phosphatase
MRKIVFSDFDGTITEHDTLDAVQDVYGPVDWRERYAEMRRSGMSMRDTTRRILETVRATPEQVEKVIESIGIRAGFDELVRYVRSHGYEFIIQSEGIDLSIRLILHQRGLDDIPFFTNQYVVNGEGRPSIVNIHSHPDCAVCGNCKSSHLIEARKTGAAIVYMGDGVTDRCPAELSDIVFARGELTEWCRSHGVPCIQFEDFRDVLKEFHREDFEARLEAESRRELARKLTLPSRDYFENEEVIRTPRFTLDAEKN